MKCENRTHTKRRVQLQDLLNQLTSFHVDGTSHPHRSRVRATARGVVHGRRRGRSVGILRYALRLLLHVAHPLREFAHTHTQLDLLHLLQTDHSRQNRHVQPCVSSPHQTQYPAECSDAPGPSANASSAMTHLPTDSSAPPLPSPCSPPFPAWNRRSPRLSTAPTPSRPARRAGISHIYESSFRNIPTSLGDRPAHCTTSLSLCVCSSNRHRLPCHPPSAPGLGADPTLSRQLLPIHSSPSPGSMRSECASKKAILRE